MSDKICPLSAALCRLSERVVDVLDDGGRVIARQEPMTCLENACALWGVTGNEFAVDPPHEHTWPNGRVEMLSIGGYRDIYGCTLRGQS